MKTNLYILLTGQIRRFKHNWNNLQRYIVEPNKDYFNEIKIIVTTWRDWDKQTHKFYDSSIQQNIDVTFEELKTYPIDINLIEFTKELNQYDSWDMRHRIMFYNWQQSLYYLNNSYQPNWFDSVIKTRSDLWYKEPLDCNYIFNHLQKSNVINIPQGSDYSGVNDQFAIGPYGLMREYLSIEKYASREPNHRPERLLQDYLDYYQIPKYRFPFEYEILR